MENSDDKKVSTKRRRISRAPGVAVEIEETPLLNPNMYETIQPSVMVLLRSKLECMLDTQYQTGDFGYMECGPPPQIYSDTLPISLINQLKNIKGMRLLENIKQGKIKAENIPKFFETFSQSEKNIIFLWSAFLQSTDLLEGLLSIGAELNFCDQNGFSALHLAAFSGSLASTTFLISKQMEVNMQPKCYTPLHCAAFGNSVETAKLLLDNGALISPETKNRSCVESPLHWAVRSNSLNCVKLFIEKGADVNSLKPNGTNAIHLAADLGYAECLEALLNAPGADPNKRICKTKPEKKESTALHLATYKDYVECVKLLLAKGAHSNLKNNRGLTALHLAAMKSSLECVQLLLEKGKANPNAEDFYHRTPLHAAIGKSEHALIILETLISYRANVNHQDIYGFTALHFAARDGLARCVEMLISFGANVTIKSKKGTAPLNFIIRQTPAAIAMITNKFNAAITLDRSQDIENKDVELKLNFRELLQHSHPHEISYLHTFVDEGQKQILEHPLCSAFLYIKWEKIRKYYYGRWIFCFVFVLFLTLYVLAAVSQNCYNGKKDDNTTIQAQELCQKQSILADLLQNNSLVMQMQNCYNGSKDGNTTIQAQELCQKQSILGDMLQNNSLVMQMQDCYNRSKDGNSTTQMLQLCQKQSLLGDMLRSNPFIMVMLWWVLVCITIFEIFRKLCGLKGYSSIQHYLTQKEIYLEWPVILSVFFIYDIPIKQTYTFHYPIGAFAVLVGWTNLMLMIGQLPVFDVYVAMYSKVLKEFGKLFVAYLCMLVGFTVSFYVIFPTSPSFADPIMGFITVLVMMGGEHDLSLLANNPDGKNPSILLEISRKITFALFLIFVTIILMNLLIGIAVHDIQGLKKTAEQSKLVQQTKLIYYMESILFEDKKSTWVNKFLHRITLKSPQPCQNELSENPFNAGGKQLPKDILMAAYKVAKKHEHSGNIISPRCSEPINFSDNDKKNNNNGQESVRLSKASISAVTPKIDDIAKHVEALTIEMQELKQLQQQASKDINEILLVISNQQRNNFEK